MIFSWHTGAITQLSLEPDYWNIEHSTTRRVEEFWSNITVGIELRALAKVEQRFIELEGTMYKDGETLFLFLNLYLHATQGKLPLLPSAPRATRARPPGLPNLRNMIRILLLRFSPSPSHVTQPCEEGFRQVSGDQLIPLFTLRNTRSGPSIWSQLPKRLPSSSFSMHISAMRAPISSGFPHFLGWSNSLQKWMDDLRK